MTSEECLDRRRRRLGWIARSSSSQELQKLRTCSGRESIGRMADNIRIPTFGQMEHDGESAWICVRVVIRDQRQSAGIGKPCRHRCGVAGDVRGPCEGSSVKRRCKCSRQHGASCMRGSKAWVQSKDRVELSKQVLAQCNKLLVRGQWHKDLLLKVSWHLRTAALQGFTVKLRTAKQFQ